MCAASAWPLALEGTPAILVLERAIAHQRLSHSLLLLGDDLELLSAVAHGVADRLLNTPKAAACYPPSRHPDCHFLRPAGKMRQISADATRNLIGQLQVSATLSSHKVAVLLDADRMHPSAANVFLKTLEEPPRDTTLLLLSTRPYALLPTIRSRVQSFRFPSSRQTLEAPGWSEWLSDYQTWLTRLLEEKPDKKSTAHLLFAAYGLVSRFAHILTEATAAAWETQKGKLPPDLGDDEQTAAESSLSVGLRARLFADIARATQRFAEPHLVSGAFPVRRPLAATIEDLEHSYGLLSLNLNENAALEDFLLATLRTWSRK